jgi:hypothetical protein
MYPNPTVKATISSAPSALITAEQQIDGKLLLASFFECYAGGNCR